jgi:hypothetical protein
LKKALFAIFAGFSLLAAVPSYAVSGLKLTCATQGLTPGSRVWVEVDPQYQGMAVGGPAHGGFREAGSPQTANAKHVWNLEVPASGEAVLSSYNFEFPASVALASADHFGSVLLKVRFRIDDPKRPHQNGYGEVTEATFEMPAPAGATGLTRCLRLRQDGERLNVETAADCRDSTFDKAARSATRVHMPAGPPSR